MHIGRTALSVLFWKEVLLTDTRSIRMSGWGYVLMRYIIVALDHNSEEVLAPDTESEYCRILMHRARDHHFTRTAEYITPNDRRLEKMKVSIIQKLGF